MITVRFATGFSVQYNSAGYVDRGTEGLARLYDKKGGTWIATVQGDCIIEGSTPPCRTYSAVRDETTETVRALMQSEFKTIQRQIRLLGKRVQP